MAEKNQKGTLKDKTWRECRAMIEHAQANGKAVPAQVLTLMEKLDLRKMMLQDPTNSDYRARALDFQQNSAHETEADLMGQLAAAHSIMSKVVAPATPATVMMLKKEQEDAGFFQIFGKVGMVRQMSIIVIFCMMLFLGLFLSEHVTRETINGDILDYEGWKFVLNQLFIIAMAALGAGFYNLFEAYKYLTEGSYDNKYDAIYWIRFILGVVSGVMLAQFILTDTTSIDSAYVFTKPLLSFLGGFSARVVHRILTRLVEALEAFIDGSAKEVAEAQRNVFETKLQNQLQELNRGQETRNTSEKLNQALKLMSIKEKFNQGGMDNTNLAVVLDELINEAMSPVHAAVGAPTGGAFQPGTLPALGDVPTVNTPLSFANSPGFNMQSNMPLQPTVPVSPLNNNNINPFPSSGLPSEMQPVYPPPPSQEFGTGVPPVDNSNIHPNDFGSFEVPTDNGR